MDWAHIEITVCICDWDYGKHEQVPWDLLPGLFFLKLCNYWEATRLKSWVWQSKYLSTNFPRMQCTYFLSARRNCIQHHDHTHVFCVILLKEIFVYIVSNIVNPLRVKMELFYFAISLCYIDFCRMVRNDLLDSVCSCVLYVIMTRPCTLSSVQNCEGASLCVLVILSTFLCNWTRGMQGDPGLFLPYKDAKVKIGTDAGARAVFASPCPLKIW